MMPSSRSIWDSVDAPIQVKVFRVVRELNSGIGQGSIEENVSREVAGGAEKERQL